MNLQIYYKEIDTFINKYESYHFYTIAYKFLLVFEDYCEALLRTIIRLRLICQKMINKTKKVINYSYCEFIHDVDNYKKHAEEYKLISKTYEEYLIKFLIF